MHGEATNTWLTINYMTVFTTWTIMGIILLGCVLLSRGISRVPNGRQSLVEGIVAFAQGIVRDQIGPQTAKHIGFIGSLFLFILISNWSGVLPWKAVGLEILPPTSDINTPAALALLAVIAYFYYGIAAKGISYFKHYFQPIFIFFPLNLMEDFSRPLSLTFRLFGNITAEHLVVAVLLSLVPPLVPIPMMALGLLTGAIQAYVFALLAAAYIGGAVRESH